MRIVLECADAVPDLDFILSGDVHLLKLKSHRGIPMVQAPEFLKHSGVIPILPGQPLPQNLDLL